MSDTTQAAGSAPTEPAATRARSTTHNNHPQRNPARRSRARVNTDPWFKDCTERGIEHLARQGYEFSVDSLRELGIPEPDVAQRWGAAFAAAAARGVIEVCGAGIMWRPTGASVATRMWRGTEKFRTDRGRDAA
ncbi:hypothetical protein [Kineococcus sp. SYSU DK005]|uniref:hypothetical protein n=1 Tax=Kineococcus sp. SYSU DK005 TaxID=3383126 RepID=UPI003D7ED8B1